MMAEHIVIAGAKYKHRRLLPLASCQLFQPAGSRKQSIILRLGWTGTSTHRENRTCLDCPNWLGRLDAFFQSGTRYMALRNQLTLYMYRHCHQLPNFAAEVKFLQVCTILVYCLSFSSSRRRCAKESKMDRRPDACRDIYLPGDRYVQLDTSGLKATPYTNLLVVFIVFLSGHSGFLGTPDASSCAWAGLQTRSCLSNPGLVML
ncbi:hypothetical protein PILCRDRAFT_646764 [Piloderma croceum F 1598]|uniref:Uncharacterized protein n=1 Tax=Piloderma croceum (strain F 1598) TaxID=765440 RepID=A0A0C3F9F6_PILCF|nr:hypothetical protein PILCRDRAFT_646764 [Piloderma croceum F 1598]